MFSYNKYHKVFLHMFGGHVGALAFWLSLNSFTRMNFFLPLLLFNTRAETRPYMPIHVREYRNNFNVKISHLHNTASHYRLTFELDPKYVNICPNVCLCCCRWPYKKLVTYFIFQRNTSKLSHLDILNGWIGLETILSRSKRVRQMFPINFEQIHTIRLGWSEF